MPPQLETTDESAESKALARPQDASKQIAGDLSEREQFQKAQGNLAGLVPTEVKDDLGDDLLPGLSLAADRETATTAHGVPAVERDGTTYLTAAISNVPEVSQSVQSLNDLQALGSGIAQGAAHVAEDTLQFLNQPGAVDDALISVGPALDNTVNYYANTPPEQIGRDAQNALSYAGQALEATIGHPMQPEQRGELSGEAMAMMFPWGIKNAEVSEKFPQLLATAHDTSTGFRQAMERGIEALPNDLRHALDQSDSRIVGVRRLSDAVPHAPDDVVGHYSPAERRIAVAEEVRQPDGTWAKNPDPAFATRHEIGHSVNLQQADAAGKSFSDSPRFVEAYEKDLAALSPAQKDTLERLAKGTDSAREEVFCEAFALQTGPTAENYRRFFERSFPEVTKLLKGE